MKNKIIITVALITALMVLVVLLAFGIVMAFCLGIEYGLYILTPVAFLFAAFIFGYCMNKVIDRITKLWE